MERLQQETHQRVLHDLKVRLDRLDVRADVPGDVGVVDHLAVQPLSQALEEYPEMKTLYDKIHKEYAAPGQTIQMLVRIGKPVQQVSPSMRRDVMELIVK